MKVYRICMCILLCTTFVATSAVAQVIPPSRTANWRSAGTLIQDTNYNRIINIKEFSGVGDGITPNDQALGNALAAMQGFSGVIYFPAGNYLFQLPVNLPGGIVLRGQGSGATTLKFNLNGRDNLVTIAGAASAISTQVTNAIPKNTNAITVQSTEGFSEGDYVKLFQEDTAIIRSSWAIGSVGQLLQIQSINGNVITFTADIRRAYPLSEKPQLRKHIMVSGAGIEYLKIKRLDATIAQTSNILFDNAANCWVRGVESDSCNFAHIQISNSTHIAVTGSYFHGAFGYGGGGQGYGVSCEYTSGECLVENNIFKHLRHSMLVQSGANGNVFGYNYSVLPYKSEAFPNDYSGDIVLHGNYPYANLFEGNVVQNIIIDASHYINGPLNTLFRNRAESYGLIMSSGSGDSTNIVGSEISSTSFGKGNYMLAGTGNFEYGNNKKGTITPSGTGLLTDRSYYYDSIPLFWKNAPAWPSTGLPNSINNAGNPAKTRYNGDSNLTYSNPYLFSLDVAGASLAGVFSPQLVNYSATVAASVAGVVVTATPFDPTAKIVINGITSTGVNMFIPLQTGVNTISIMVLAKDGISRKSYTCLITRLKPVVTFSGRVLLQGAYNPVTNQMTNTLNLSGILAANAGTNPYTAAPFNYTGSDTVPPSIFVAHPQIVDWILVELRSAGNPQLGIAKQVALLAQNGSILGLDGQTTMISFNGVDTGSYYVVVRHRNHLGIRTTMPLHFAGSGTYDFTSGAEQCFQNQAYTSTALVGSNWVMRAGNANADFVSKYTGPLNDQNHIFNVRLGSSFSSVITNVYAPEDINMDGTIKWNGVNNDQSFLLNVVLNGSISKVYQEQLY